MSGEREQRVKELLAQLLDISADGRAAVLELACGDDAGLRSEVESLAQAYEEAPEFLATRQSSTSDVPFPDASEPAGTHIGRYIILEKIGEGGFGTVFLAEQMHPVRRTVALKLLKAGMDTKQVIGRFSAERQALAMMDHPNVAKVLDAGSTDSGRPYFVMDLIRGTPITRYCDEHKLTIRQRLELFLQVCQGVQHAHTKGIIHRDLKPSNVLVTESDGAAIPKVIDFGIAKATTGPLTDQTMLTELRQLLGTPQYMSPEQADGSADIDTRSDVYSLGVILYELLSGSTPFDFKTSGFAEVHRVIREVEPPPPSARVAQRELKGDLDRIVLKAMEKDRVRRYETASALGSDIRRYLNHEPVIARHATWLCRVRKMAARNRVAFTSASIVLVALVVGLALSTWGFDRATKAERAQEALRDDAETKAYLSDMNLVQQALAVYNLGGARKILESHRPKPRERDRRGWEWRYLLERCRSDAVRQFCQRPIEISTLSVSADGRWLAVGEREGGGLSLWDLQTAKELPRPDAGDLNVQTAFSPRGPLLAFTSVRNVGGARQDYHLGLWDMRSGRLTASVVLDAYPTGLAFSADGGTLLVSTGGADGAVTVWQVLPELSKIQSYPLTAEIEPARVRFVAAPDAKRVAVIQAENEDQDDDKLCVLDLTSQFVWSISHRALTCAAFSPDGRIVAAATGMVDPQILLLDASTGKPLGPPVVGHSAWIGSLVFLSDGRTLASASADQTIRLWDVRNPTNVKPVGRPLLGHLQEVWRLALMPDKRTLVSAAKDGSVCIWDTSRHRQDADHVIIPDVVDFGFDAGTDSLIAVHADGSVMRSPGSNPLSSSPIMRLREPVARARVVQGHSLVARSGDMVEAWDLQTITPIWRLPASGADMARIALAGHWSAFPGSPGCARKCDVRAMLSSAHVPADLQVVAFAPDGRRGLALAMSGTGMFTDVTTGVTVSVKLDIRQVSDAAFSADSSMIAVSSELGFTGVWRTAELRQGERVRPLMKFGGFQMSPHSVGFSPDGRRLAAGGNGAQAVKLYDLQTGQEVLTLAGTAASFIRVEFSPDGSMIAAVNEQRELHFWRAPTQAEIDAAEANQPVVE